MKRSTHAWIAIRAIALLEDKGGSPGLVKLLTPYASKASIGAWIPDINEACRSGFTTMNHVFQNLPYKGPNKSRFIARKKDLIKRMTGCPAVKQYLDDDTFLDAKWWGTAYKADARPGQHIPNRIMGLATMLEDLIPLGDDVIEKQMAKPVKALKEMDEKAHTSSLQMAYYFFMMSHYIADSCMPCHCDGRDFVSRTGKKGKDLHTGMEKAWEKSLSADFKDKNLLSDKLNSKELLAKAKEMDANYKLKFTTTIKDLKKGRDVWKEGVDNCRAYFAVASIIAPHTVYSYKPVKGDARLAFDAIFPKSNKADFDKYSAIIMHDAVYNTAMVWNHVWLKATT